MIHVVRAYEKMENVERAVVRRVGKKKPWGYQAGNLGNYVFCIMTHRWYDISKDGEGSEITTFEH